METDKVLVSVVIPIYNTPGDILGKSLDSILAQDFDSFEVICIDDCSNHVETITTLNEYNKNNDKLHLITLERNAGAANARNVGLSKSCGEYVIFLDADDLFSERLLRCLYDEIRKDDSDICLFEYSFLEEKNGEVHITEVSGLDINSDYINDEMFVTSVPASGSNRLCKRKYLYDNNIKFQNLSSDNDTYFSLMTLLCAERIAVVNDPSLLFYRFNTDFQISKKMNPLNLWSAIQKTKKELLERDILGWTRAIDAYTIKTGIMEMGRCKTRDNARKFYYEFKSYLQKDSIKFENYQLNVCLKKWLEEDFESEWYLQAGDYGKQLEEHTNDLLGMLMGKKKIFVWGNGARGKAFESWAEKNNISLSGICDKKEQNINEVDDYGVLIVGCEYVKHECGYIIASNEIIYNAICDEFQKDNVLNLERYCPL